jgi:spore cortex formation protein SpoVR/YcgB (stage V sporulation)
MSYVEEPNDGVIASAEIMLWREQLSRAAERLTQGKLRHRDAQYYPYTNSDLVRLLANRWFPSHYESWKWGKKAVEERGDPRHVLEAIANTDPLTCYVNDRQPLSRIIRGIAHGEFGRGIVFANNRWFADTYPATAVDEFAEHARLVEHLCQLWGRETVDFYLDALHSLAAHVPQWLSIEDYGEDDIQKGVGQRLDQLQRKLINTRGGKQEVEELLGEVQTLMPFLARHPTQPMADLLGFLFSERLNPGIDPDLRRLIGMVRRRQQHFVFEETTSLVTAGFAAFFAELLLKQPEMAELLSPGLKLQIARSQAVHYRFAADNYFDSYVLGLTIFEHIFEKFCPQDGVETAMVQEMTRDAGGVLTAGEMVAKETRRYNLDFMIEVVKNYNNRQLLTEFLDADLLERLHKRCLAYVHDRMLSVNQNLKRTGWGAQVVAEPLPTEIEDLIKIVDEWSKLKQASAKGFLEKGTPDFPAIGEELNDLSRTLQIVAGFDQRPFDSKQAILLEINLAWVPNITVTTNGDGDDGVIVLQHTIDLDRGPLQQNDAASTLERFRRLSDRPVRLVTKEPRTKDDPTLEDYYYFIDDVGDEPKKGYVTYVPPAPTPQYSCGCEG